MSASRPIDPAFALALLSLEGVGRVTAHKIMERFPNYDDLLACPHEQVLLRIKGTPRADQLVRKLFDVDVLVPAIEHQHAIIRNMDERNISLLTSGHPSWPSQLDVLPRSDRPVVLYAFGHPSILAANSVALFGSEGISASAFEVAQTLASKLIKEGITLCTAARTGFDAVLHRLCADGSHPCIMVAHCGLARIDHRARASVAQAVKAGGVLISSFPMSHGPFDHDDTERALLQAVLGGPAAFFDPQKHSPESTAMQWAIHAKKPVFGLSTETGNTAESLPDHVHVLKRPVDYDWVIAAALDSADSADSAR
ncbi:MAG: DNA-processing protein DprA [Rubricoccaceae bacterium]|nr:DNA-processing protein DprA [Rubricoccaceae bacterium]